MANASRFSLAARSSRMYSQVGSRGLPWTSVNVSSTIRSGRAASHSRVVGAIRSRVHSIAVRASRLKQLRTESAHRDLIVIAEDAGRPHTVEAFHDAVRFGAVADDVAEDADAVDRSDRREHRIEGDEIGVDVRKDRQAHRRKA